MKVRIQVIKVYDIDVSTTDDGEAIEIAYDMQTVDIEEHGRLIDAMTDHAEIYDDIDVRQLRRDHIAFLERIKKGQITESSSSTRLS